MSHTNESYKNVDEIDWNLKKIGDFGCELKYIS